MTKLTTTQDRKDLARLSARLRQMAEDTLCNVKQLMMIVDVHTSNHSRAVKTKREYAMDEPDTVRLVRQIGSYVQRMADENQSISEILRLARVKSSLNVIRFSAEDLMGSSKSIQTDSFMEDVSSLERSKQIIDKFIETGQGKEAIKQIILEITTLSNVKEHESAQQNHDFSLLLGTSNSHVLNSLSLNNSLHEQANMLNDISKISHNASNEILDKNIESVDEKFQINKSMLSNASSQIPVNSKLVPSTKEHQNQDSTAGTFT